MIYSRIRNIALQFPKKLAVIDDDCKLSYSQLLEYSNFMGNTLLNNDLQENDKVIVLLNTSASAIVSLLSVNKIGAIFIPVSTKLKEFGLDQYISLISPKLIITNNKYKNQVTKYSGLFTIMYIEIKEQELLYSIDNKEENKISLQNDIEISSYYSQKDKKERIAEILFTSGSTGKPKGIMLTNNNIESNVDDIRDYLKMNDSDVSLVVKPLIHSSTLNGEIITSLFTGSTIVTTQKLITPSLIINYIEKYKVTVLFLIPTLLIKILNYKGLNSKDIESLKIVHFYGSTIPENVLLKCINDLKHVNIIYSYGLTEASPRVTFIETENILKKLESSGKALNHVKVTIRDEKSHEILIQNQVGEIYVEGPNVMEGYFNDEKLTKKVLTKYGLKTGDLGYFDEDGFVYVLGRKDEMIIKGGVNIYPAEIESVLSLCPMVEQVLVKGIKDSDLGERIQALIVCKKEYDDNNKNLRDIFEHCKKFMEVNKVPDIIKIVEQLELTLTGKIKRS